MYMLHHVACDWGYPHTSYRGHHCQKYSESWHTFLHLNHLDNRFGSCIPVQKETLPNMRKSVGKSVTRPWWPAQHKLQTLPWSNFDRCSSGFILFQMESLEQEQRWLTWLLCAWLHQDWRTLNLLLSARTLSTIVNVWRSIDLSPVC